MPKIKVVVLLFRQLRHGFTKTAKMSPNLTDAQFGLLLFSSLPRLYSTGHNCRPRRLFCFDMFKTIVGVLRIDDYSYCIDELRVKKWQLLLVCILSIVFKAALHGTIRPHGACRLPCTWANRSVWHVARMSRTRDNRVKGNYSSFYFRPDSAARAVRLPNQSAADT